MMKVLFLVPYCTEGASNRIRVEQYIPYLAEHGVSSVLSPFVHSSFYRILYRQGYYGAKAGHFCISSLRRFADCVRASRFDLVVVHREAYPLGPPWLEAFINRLGVPIVYDFDDAIFLPHVSETHTYLERFKRSNKVASIIRWSEEVIAGNEFLAHFARRFNEKTTVIPTVVDTDLYRPSDAGPTRSEVVIGWIGSLTTRKFLTALTPAFRALAERYPQVRFELVGTDSLLDGVARMVVRPWKLERELDDLHGFDIGVMPLPDDLWAQGKCGFKAILYQACGLPVVCSPVGVNREIVHDGVNGLLADGLDEWVEKLSGLIEDEELRRSLGEKGRQSVEVRYSVKAHRDNFLAVLERAASAGGKSR